MYARPNISLTDEAHAEEAFVIAWQFIRRSGDVRDETLVQSFIAATIVRLLERGERHKLRLANLTISAYQQCTQADQERALSIYFID